MSVLQSLLAYTQRPRKRVRFSPEPLQSITSSSSHVLDAGIQKLSIDQTSSSSNVIESPIARPPANDRLPNEILGEIFLFAVVEQFQVEADLKRNQFVPVVRKLVQVCTTWRYAGHRCPRAWSFILLPLSHFPRRASYHMSHVKDALQFSGSVALHVRMHIAPSGWTLPDGRRGPFPWEQKNAQHQLFLNSGRWKTLTLFAALPEDVTQAAVKAGMLAMPLLQTIRVRFLARAVKTTDVFFQLAPNVQRFELDHITDTRFFKIRHTGLTHITFRKPAILTDILDALHLCSRVESFHFAYDASLPITQERLDTSLPPLRTNIRLRNLSVTVRGAHNPQGDEVSLAHALSRFRTPGLAALCIYSASCTWFGMGSTYDLEDSEDAIEARKVGVGVPDNLLSYDPLALPPRLSSFIAQAVSLTTLELRCNELTEWILIECLQAAPGLRYFGAGRKSSNFDSSTHSTGLGNDLIRRLTKGNRHPNEKPMPLLAPGLETLDIEGRDFSLTLFVDMVQSRWNGLGIKSDIRSVTLRLMPVPPQEEDLYRSEFDFQRLQNLEKKGLEVAVIDLA